MVNKVAKIQEVVEELKLNHTFDSALNSPFELNKTLCFVRLVGFIFNLQNSRSRQTLENSHTTKILVTFKKFSPHPRTCSFHIWYCSQIIH